MEQIISQDAFRQQERLLENEELFSHLNMLAEQTMKRKVAWKIVKYVPVHLHVDNPFVEDIAASLSHEILLEKQSSELTAQYEIYESIHLPSGLPDIEITEILSDIRNTDALSYDKNYINISSQAELLRVYAENPMVKFAKAVFSTVGADLQSFSPEDCWFSLEPVPSILVNNPVVHKALRLNELCDAEGFHRLVMSNQLRSGLETPGG